jgi:hypothetical protein
MAFTVNPGLPANILIYFWGQFRGENQRKSESFIRVFVQYVYTKRTNAFKLSKVFTNVRLLIYYFSELKWKQFE